MQETSLTALQLEIMDILWRKGEASAADIRAALKPERDLAMSTVSTMLSRLEDKQAVAHRREGRRFIYYPRLSQQRTRRSVVADVLQRFFKGDAQALVSHLLEEAEIAPEELIELQRKVDQMDGNADTES